MQFFSSNHFPYHRFAFASMEKKDLLMLFSLLKQNPDSENMVSTLLDISPTILCKYMILPEPDCDFEKRIRERILSTCNTHPRLHTYWLKELNELTQKKYTTDSLAYTNATPFELYISEFLYLHRSDTCMTLYRLEDEDKTSSMEYDACLQLISQDRDVDTTHEETSQNEAVLIRAADLGHFQALKRLVKLWMQNDKGIEDVTAHQALLFKWARDFHGSAGLIVLISYIWGNKERPNNPVLIFYLSKLAMALNDYTPILADGVLTSNKLLYDYFERLPGFKETTNIMTYLSCYLRLPKGTCQLSALSDASAILHKKGLLKQNANAKEKGVDVVSSETASSYSSTI